MVKPSGLVGLEFLKVSFDLINRTINVRKLLVKSIILCGKIYIIFGGKHRGKIRVHAFSNTGVVCQNRSIYIQRDEVICASSLGLDKIPEMFRVIVFLQIKS